MQFLRKISLCVFFISYSGSRAVNGKRFLESNAFSIQGNYFRLFKLLIGKTKSTSHLIFYGCMLYMGVHMLYIGLHCTMYALHGCYSILCMLFSVHGCRVHCTLYAVLHMLYNVHGCTLYCVCCTWVYTVPCILYCIYCTWVYTVLCMLYMGVHCTVYAVHGCTLYSVHRILYCVCSTWVYAVYGFTL